MTTMNRSDERTRRETTARGECDVYRRRRVIGIVLFGAVLAAGCGRPAQKAVVGASAATAVETTMVQLGDQRNDVEVGGTIRGRSSAVVSARMVASVASLAVTAGMPVRAGQLLVRLDDRDVAAGARQATASAASAEQALARAESERESAEASATLARATGARIATLHARRSATTQELDDATAGQATAEARLAAARAAVEQARSALEAARAGGDAASVTASFARVVAPFDGVVTETFVDRGQLVTPGTPLVQVEDVRAYELAVRVDESRGTGLSVGAPVDVSCDGPTGPVTQQGRILEIGRATDVDSRTLLVKVSLAPGEGVRAGGFARAHLPGPSRRVVTVPASAIAESGQVTTVFVVEGGRARLRLVRVGRSTGHDVEILAGLAEPDVVVVNPPVTLREGSPVAMRGQR